MLEEGFAAAAVLNTMGFPVGVQLASRLVPDVTHFLASYVDSVSSQTSPPARHPVGIIVAAFFCCCGMGRYFCQHYDFCGIGLAAVALVSPFSTILLLLPFLLLLRRVPFFAF